MRIDEFELIKIDEADVSKVLGIRGLFIKGKKREDFLTSKQVSLTLKKYKKDGVDISRKDVPKIKFEHDPIYRQHVIDRIHKKCDRKHQKEIKKCNNRVLKLQNMRNSEINRIILSRWSSLANGLIKYNIAEGRIVINNINTYFSNIKDVYINTNSSFRLETIGNGSSKKHISVGGAIVGGIAFGGAGALVGGTALGKTTHKFRSETNAIETSDHVGVVVNISGLEEEIIILDHSVDQNSSEFNKAMSEAELIVIKLQELSCTPVPTRVLNPEQEQSVLEINEQLKSACEALEKIKGQVPTYKIPDKYL